MTKNNQMEEARKLRALLLDNRQYFKSRGLSNSSFRLFYAMAYFEKGLCQTTTASMVEIAKEMCSTRKTASKALKQLDGVLCDVVIGTGTRITTFRRYTLDEVKKAMSLTKQSTR